MATILTSGFIYIYGKTIERHLISYGQKALDSETLYVNAIIGSTKDLLDNVSLDADVSRLLNYENISASDLLSGLRRLSTYESSNYFIDSIYIYNKRNGNVYNSSPHMPEAVYSIDDFPDFEATGIFKNYSKINNLEPVFRTFNSFFPSVSELHYLSFIRYNTLVKENDSNVIMVNIRQDMLSPLVSENESNGELLLLMDNNTDSCQIIAGNRTIVSDKLMTEVLKKLGKSTDNFTVHSDRKSFIVCQSSILNGKARLIMIADETVIDSITRTKGYGNAIVFLALLFAISLIITILIFRFIWKIIRNQNAEIALNRRNLFLSALHAETSFDSSGLLEQDTKETIVVVLTIDGYADLIEQLDKTSDRNIIKEKICQSASALFGKESHPIATYENDDRCIIIIQNPCDVYDFEKIRTEIASENNVSVSLFLSERCPVEQIPIEYDFLCRSLSYRLLFGKDRVVTVEMVEEREMTTYSIPDTMLRKLSEEILKLNIPGAMLIVKELLQGISEGSYRSAQMNLINLSSVLDDTILKLLNNNGIENNELAEALAYKVLRIESIEGIYSYIEDLLLNAESAVERNKNSRQSELVNEIIRITKENCESRTFSIDIVAEKLGMTSAYLGKVFKRTTGETFSRFVLNERMTIACRLLAETDEPIDSIIYSVGFGDTPYFYKLFKQLNGCTPAKYRETHRTQ
ncbi:MAG: AraC family transcriptional regulator [Spirochaetales bacterium]|nr:AraC family transcriptional regulator [Spirochaetales bacterium]